jgi:hypothetical protein
VENGGQDYRTTAFKLVMVALLVPAAVAAWWLRERHEARKPIASNERNASASLRYLAGVEEDFRQNDRDRNGVQDYWTRDIAGLHQFKLTARSSPAVDLIPRSYADADGAAQGSWPRNGYYYKAVELDETGRPYASTEVSTTKFALCAYPADYDRTGRWTFVINEAKSLYRVDTGGKPITRWAPDPATWKPLD